MPRTHIGIHTVEEIRDHYRRYLFGEYLPFWNRHGVDHQHGGFFCALDHDGTRLEDSKFMWYQGRGLWVYSHLARHFGDAEALEIARKTAGFLLAHGRDREGWWAEWLEADGRVRAGRTYRGYESLFVAEGLQAYAAVTGDERAFEVARTTLLKVVELYRDPRRPVNEDYIPLCYPGMRILGEFMVLILTLTQMLEQRPGDAELAALADEMVQGITVEFWNEHYQLTNEVRTCDLRRPEDPNEDFCYLGHGIETMWMTMAEALRRQDHTLFELCAARFRRHVKVAWDDVYGGLFRSLRVKSNYYELDKVLWLQEEGLIGCLMLMEHTEDEWSWEWFARIYEWIETRCALRHHGYPLYQVGGDRQMSFGPHSNRKENYHHPRCVMYCLLALERMIGRGGAVSGVWG
ncbi:MAG: AGE family epimerase/isomerase [Candidatus Handelsmanbacteria bacterium]|nr:AGE family epimerase/isomerase [Candidatus Handelsmanbacteria bacterium]